MIILFIIVVVVSLYFMFLQENHIKYVNTKNGKFYYDSKDIYIANSFNRGEVFEEEIINNVLKPYILNSRTIIDMGANIGSHTISYANMNKNCKIHSFEPQKNLFNILEKNVYLNNIQDNVILYDKAVGHINDYFELDPIPVDEEFYNKGGLKLGKGGEKCEMITLDSLNLNSCDFIKMDIQGSEPLALQGGINTIKKFRPVIFFEYTPGIPDVDIKPSELNIESIPDTLDLLKSFGYKRIIEVENSGNFIAEY